MTKFKVVFLFIILIPFSGILQIPFVSAIETSRENIPADAISFYNDLVGTDWSAFRNPGDDQLYYSIAGGIAGLGLELIKIGSQDSISLAENIANDLLKFSSTKNSTHLIWDVNDNNTIVDLGYDFGLSGIAAFFSKLAIVTQNSSYTSFARQTLNSIYDLSDLSNGGISWTTNLSYLDGNYWYAFDYFTNDMEVAVYTGKAFGTIGLGYAILDYIEAPSADLTFADELLDRINIFIQDSTILTSGSATLPIVSGGTVVSNSRSFGMSGLGEYYVNYLMYRNESSIQIRLNEVKAWVIQNLFGNLYTTELSTDSYWTGLELGLAGNLRFLSLVYGQLNLTEQNSVIDLSNRLSLLRESTDGGLIFPEFVDRGIPIDPSHSLAYGTVGILETLLSFGNLIEQNKEINRLDLYRNAIAADIANYTAGLYYPIVKDYGHGMAVGLAGVINLFTLDSPVLVTSSSNSVNFGQKKIGRTYTETLVLSNFGFESALVEVNSSSPFSTNLTSFTISAGKSVVVGIIFNPENETALQSSIFFEINNSTVLGVSVFGQGIDNPHVNLIGVENNSVIKGVVDFNFEITDSSPLKFVTMVIYDGAGREILTQTLDSDSSIFVYQWNTLSVDNGNYTVQIRTEDIHDRRTEISFFFTINNPVEKIADYFSTNTFFYGTVATLVVLIAFVSYQFINIRRRSG